MEVAPLLLFHLVMVSLDRLEPQWFIHPRLCCLLDRILKAEEEDHRPGVPEDVELLEEVIRQCQCLCAAVRARL